MGVKAEMRLAVGRTAVAEKIWAALLVPPGVYRPMLG
jgi:hypothetical protein